ncbi:transcriptional coactivator YAP1 isoform X1 [Hetaerina americana]|uniref:transcriptional coactivator YAP1 isoform X1 n=1 Tax=Hetaerina americana TaxID=62018 RepID=UPI003A7F6008
MAGLGPQRPEVVGGKAGSGSGNNNLVVRIDGDGDSDLQALFDSVLKPDSKRPLQVPLRMRKLPNSFFNPPHTGSKSPSISHSRENSADSAFGSSPSTTSSAANPSSSPSPSSSPANPPPPLQVCHPRAHSSPASLQQTYASAQPLRSQQQQGSILGHQHGKQRSYDLGDDLTPLPPGWEQARTREGQVYYLNHITRTTTWEDPRKSLAVQVQRQQQVASANPNSDVVGVGSVAGALPDGWEQAATAEGEIYFINHQTRTTSWFDPRIPIHLQRPAVLQQTQQASEVTGTNWSHRHSSTSSPTSPSSPSAARQNAQVCQQKLRLQNLEMERERLKMRQQEIIRKQQEMMLRQSVVEDPSASADGTGVSGGSQGSANAGTDPFLGGPTDHSRQESADSGLGMGNPYSLPHTPEDFLSNMDDHMDGVNEGGSPVGGDEMGGGLDAPDISSLGSDNVDPTDDLVPSLQLSEEFSSEILDDVQSLINPSKQDNALTWL